MSREARRAQLLDVAGRLLIERGAGAVTMERLAEHAGVSKALPYSHFDNSDDVLVALYEQVVGRLGRRILRAIADADDGTDLVPVIIDAYLDAVADLGPVLGAVTRPGSLPSELADGDKRVGPTFVAEILVRHFDVSTDRADLVAPILLSALTGAVGAWAAQPRRRREVQELAVAVMRTLVDS